MSFNELVDNELKRARAKHKSANSLHEGYAIILEEFEEFWDTIKNNEGKQRSLEELIQVAAMCKRVAEDLLLKC